MKAWQQFVSGNRKKSQVIFNYPHLSEPPVRRWAGSFSLRLLGGILAVAMFKKKQAHHFLFY